MTERVRGFIEKARRDGRCTHCRSREAKPGCVQCHVCINRSAECSDNARERRRAAGQCLTCLEMQAPPAREAGEGPLHHKRVQGQGEAEPSQM